MSCKYSYHNSPLVQFFISDDKNCLYRGSDESVLSVEKQISYSVSHQEVLKDPVSFSCGHLSCRQCVTSYKDKSALLGRPCCPQCGKRLTSRDGPQTNSPSSSLQGKTFLTFQSRPDHSDFTINGNFRFLPQHSGSRHVFAYISKFNGHNVYNIIIPTHNSFKIIKLVLLAQR